MALPETPYSRRVNGYLLLLDTYSGRWMITRRSNHISSGYTLEEAIAWAERH